MSENSEAEIHAGGCQCGAVRYRVRGPITDCSICHCRMCQKAGGAPFMVLFAVDSDAVSWSRGAPATFASSSLARRGFCRDCGTPLTYQSKPERIELTHGSLDEPARVTPTRRLSSETVLPWSETVGHLPIQPLAEWQATKPPVAIITYQHPDHD